jgi:hypothetical protein
MILYKSGTAPAQFVTVNFLNFIYSSACFSQDKLLFSSLFLKRDTIKKSADIRCLRRDYIYDLCTLIATGMWLLQVYSDKEAPSS